MFTFAVNTASGFVGGRKFRLVTAKAHHTVGRAVKAIPGAG